MRKLFSKILITLVFVLLLSNCINKSANVKYAGVRSSSYGIMPFPGPSGWRQAIDTISGNFKNSIPFAIWILGEMGTTNEICQLQFPSDGNEYYNISFETTDKHEHYLDYFDKHGIKVFLQVEPCSADVETLIDLVLTRYKHHECVIGFGVDNEWYQQKEAEDAGMDPGFGMKVLDEDAEAWEKKVKSYNPEYRLFFKHWDYNWMPSNYRGDIIFINDTQEVASLKSIYFEYKAWADAVYPNDVIFQTGYLSDKKWWKKLSNPPLEIGKAAKKYGIRQKNIGVCWVDFTLNDVTPTEGYGDDELVVDDPGNIAIGKTAVASEIEADGYNAGMAVDGNPSTRWSSRDVDPSWIYVDLEKETEIGKVTLVWETSYSSHYKIQVSNDAKEWNTVYEKADSEGGIEEIEVDAKGRYVRLFGTKRKFDKPEYGHSLWEMKVYEK